MMLTDKAQVTVGCTCNKAWYRCECKTAERWVVEISYDFDKPRDEVADDVRRLLGEGFEKATIWI